VRALGSPEGKTIDQLRVLDIETPPLGKGQVQVRVVASAVNPADLKVLRSELAGRFLHARTKPLVSGFDFSGVVEACEKKVTDLRAGDEVFGFLAYSSRTKQGAFGERVVVDRSTIARKPAKVPHDVAAAAATPGLSALQALRDKGKLKPGARLLVTGASGGVGSLAVGIARMKWKAHVTAVCSTNAVQFVRELGAEEVVDRKISDPRKLTGPFDVIFDAAAAYSFGSMQHALSDEGAYVTTLPSASFVTGKLRAVASRKRCHTFVVHPTQGDLDELAQLLAAGLRVPIDSHFAVRDLARACDHFTKGELRGRITIDVESGW
jgi:NADPH:quinone reductase-like Zn-dependent oxidoreductase